MESEGLLENKGIAMPYLEREIWERELVWAKFNLKHPEL